MAVRDPYGQQGSNEGLRLDRLEAVPHAFLVTMGLFIWAVMGGAILGTLSTFAYRPIGFPFSTFVGGIVGALTSPAIIVLIFRKHILKAVIGIYLITGVVAIAVSYFDSIEISFGATVITFLTCALGANIWLPMRHASSRDLTCPECGYDLRGAGYQSGCPECGWNRDLHELT